MAAVVLAPVCINSHAHAQEGYTRDSIVEFQPVPRFDEVNPEMVADENLAESQVDALDDSQSAELAHKALAQLREKQESQDNIDENNKEDNMQIMVQQKLNSVRNHKIEVMRSNVDLYRINDSSGITVDTSKSIQEQVTEKLSKLRTQIGNYPSLQNQGNTILSASSNINNSMVYMPAQGAFTSGFGPRWGTFHAGIDIANSVGTPIYAVMSGTVIDSGPASGYGNWIRIRHNDGSMSTYGHMETLNVSVGQTVAAGQIIAGMGNRGFSTGPHLHFEIAPDGSTPVDPVSWFSMHGINKIG